MSNSSAGSPAASAATGATATKKDTKASDAGAVPEMTEATEPSSKAQGDESEKNEMNTTELPPAVPTPEAGAEDGTELKTNDTEKDATENENASGNENGTENSSANADKSEGVDGKSAPGADVNAGTDTKTDADGVSGGQEAAPGVDGAGPEAANGVSADSGKENEKLSDPVKPDPPEGLVEGGALNTAKGSSDSGDSDDKIKSSVIANPGPNMSADQEMNESKPPSVEAEETSMDKEKSLPLNVAHESLVPPPVLNGDTSMSDVAIEAPTGAPSTEAAKEGEGTSAGAGLNAESGKIEHNSVSSETSQVSGSAESKSLTPATDKALDPAQNSNLPADGVSTTEIAQTNATSTTRFVAGSADGPATSYGPGELSAGTLNASSGQISTPLEATGGNPSAPVDGTSTTTIDPAAISENPAQPMEVEGSTDVGADGAEPTGTGVAGATINDPSVKPLGPTGDVLATGITSTTLEQGDAISKPGVAGAAASESPPPPPPPPPPSETALASAAPGAAALPAPNATSGDIPVASATVAPTTGATLTASQGPNPSVATIPLPKPLNKAMSTGSSSSVAEAASLKRSASASSMTSRRLSKSRMEALKRKGAVGCFVLVAPFCDLETLENLALVCKAAKTIVVQRPEWRLKTMCLAKDLSGHIAPVNVLLTEAFFVFSGSSDGKIKIWNSKTWQCDRTLDLSLAPSQQSVAATVAEKPPASSKSTRGKRPSSRATVTQETEGESEQTNAVTSLAAFDMMLFIGLESGNFIIRMIREKDFGLKNHKVHAHDGAIKAIAVHKGLGKFFTGGADAKIHAFDSKSAARVATFDQHTDKVTALEICGNRLFSGGMDGKLCVFSLSSQSLEFDRFLTPPSSTGETSKSCITALASYDGKIYSASWDCYIRVWDAKELTLLSEVFILPVGVCWSMAVRLVKNQPPTLVVGVRDGEVELRSLDSSNKLKLITTLKAPKPKRHTDWVTCVLPLPDGRIVSGSEDWSLKVWNYRFAPPIVAPSGNARGQRLSASQAAQARANAAGRNQAQMQAAPAAPGSMHHPQQPPTQSHPGYAPHVVAQGLVAGQPGAHAGYSYQPGQAQPYSAQGYQVAPTYPTNYAQVPNAQMGHAGPRGPPGRPYLPSNQMQQQQQHMVQRHMFQQQQQQGGAVMPSPGLQASPTRYPEQGQQPHGVYSAQQQQQMGRGYPAQQYPAYQQAAPRGYTPRPPHYASQRP